MESIKFGSMSEFWATAPHGLLKISWIKFENFGYTWNEILSFQIVLKDYHRSLELNTAALGHIPKVYMAISRIWNEIEEKNWLRYASY